MISDGIWHAQVVGTVFRQGLRPATCRIFRKVDAPWWSRLMILMCGSVVILCRYTYIYTYIYIYTYVYIYICIYVSKYIFTYIYICISIYNMYICIYIYMYVCMHVCMYVCMDGWMDGWMYIYIYIHTYTRLDKSKWYPSIVFPNSIDMCLYMTGCWYMFISQFVLIGSNLP